jgi:hypothetical protein
MSCQNPIVAKSIPLPPSSAAAAGPDKRAASVVSHFATLNARANYGTRCGNTKIQICS